ncbi:MAG: spore cortex-lytic enzyme [Clostridia bacterium]|nr:spore cortex-lytic enzyme [Clostridia bacterium]
MSLGSRRLVHVLAAMGIAALILIAPATAFAETRPTLYWGTSGASVRLAQWKLSQWGYYRGAVDGVFGTRTSLAVRGFQRKNGLAADGVVGRATWRALGFGFTAPAPSVTARAYVMPSRAASVDLLARVIAAESRGEPYRGQVAVGAVILNRVAASGFPHSVSAVVFQPHALESVSNGLIWRRSPDSVAYSAARDAVNGFDPSYGSLFFWNPYKPVSGWIWTRRVVVQIGRHLFAR